MKIIGHQRTATPVAHLRAATDITVPVPWRVQEVQPCPRTTTFIIATITTIFTAARITLNTEATMYLSTRNWVINQLWLLTLLPLLLLFNKSLNRRLLSLIQALVRTAKVTSIARQLLPLNPFPLWGSWREGTPRIRRNGAGLSVSTPRSLTSAIVFQMFPPTPNCPRWDE